MTWSVFGMPLGTRLRFSNFDILCIDQGVCKSLSLSGVLMKSACFAILSRFFFRWDKFGVRYSHKGDVMSQYG